MPKKTKTPVKTTESDSTYFLKLVLYVILGTFWLKFQAPLELAGFVIHGLPLGLIVGLLFASHEHFQVDKKIEYAILVVMTIVSFFLPAGIVI